MSIRPTSCGIRRFLLSWSSDSRLVWESSGESGGSIGEEGQFVGLYGALIIGCPHQKGSTGRDKRMFV